MGKKSGFQKFLDGDSEEEPPRSPVVPPRRISLTSPGGDRTELNPVKSAGGKHSGSLRPAGPGGLGELRGGRGGSRSPSPAPLEHSHSATSVGPGLAGLGASGRQLSPSPVQGRKGQSLEMGDPPGRRGASPAPLEPPRGRGGSRSPSPRPGDLQSHTSVGPGLGGLSPMAGGGNRRTLSPSPSAAGLQQDQSMTGVGPGLAGLSRNRSKSPAPDHAHSLTSLGPGIGPPGGLRGRSPSPAPMGAPRLSQHEAPGLAPEAPGRPVRPGSARPRASSLAPSEAEEADGDRRRKDKKEKKEKKHKRRPLDDDEFSSGGESSRPLPISRQGSEDSLASVSVPLAGGEKKKRQKDKKEKKDKKKHHGEEFSDGGTPEGGRSLLGLDKADKRDRQPPSARSATSSQPQQPPAARKPAEPEPRSAKRAAAPATAQDYDDEGFEIEDDEEDSLEQRLAGGTTELAKKPEKPAAKEAAAPARRADPPRSSEPAAPKADAKAQRPARAEEADGEAQRPAKAEEARRGSGAEVSRFLVRFEPPTLAVEWGSGPGEQRQLSAIPVDAGDLVDTNILAGKLVLQRPFLGQQHKQQIEALLRQLALKALPTYRVVCEGGADVFPDEDPYRVPLRPAPAASPVAQLPSGALLLVHERAHLESEGWWLRLATGGGWIRSDARGGTSKQAAERCEPREDEARSWLRKCEGDGRSSQGGGESLVLRQARAVLLQVERRAAVAR